MGNYYSGGFAEIVPNPTPLTYSYLRDWFNGKASLGKAMQILGLPFRKIDLPILEVVESELLVNLKSEEETLYKNTIFKYQKQTNITDTPKLIISPFKLLNPLNWVETLILLIKQSIWISNPAKVLKTAQNILDNIPQTGFEDINATLKDQVWPGVIAIGVLTEFFNQLIKHEGGQDFYYIQSYISQKLSFKDWFFLSFFEQRDVFEGKLSFEDYLEKYGIKSDKDYELNSPRWYEIPDILRDRINQTKINFIKTQVDEEKYQKLSSKLKLYIDTAVELQILRSEAKKKALFVIDQLRQGIIKSGFEFEKIENIDKIKQSFKKADLKNGKGVGVSQGIVSGVVKHINSNSQNIFDGTIGIFPNASPEFSTQYPKCKGMIFLKGGQTSHGAIVAREFGVPALIDISAKDLEDGSQITINGIEGTWVANNI